jgi:hypothetical protein
VTAGRADRCAGCGMSGGPAGERVVPYRDGEGVVTMYSKSRLPRDGVALGGQVVQAGQTPARGLKYGVVMHGWRQTADKGTALTCALHDDA